MALVAPVGGAIVLSFEETKRPDFLGFVSIDGSLDLAQTPAQGDLSIGSNDIGPTSDNSQA